MTREEVLDKFDKNTGWFKYHPFDAVHNARKEFIELMNDFESRTCENCKYYSALFYQGFVESDCLELNMEVEPDFGCNKFEKKDEK